MNNRAEKIREGLSSVSTKEWNTINWQDHSEASEASPKMFEVVDGKLKYMVIDYRVKCIISILISKSSIKEGEEPWYDSLTQRTIETKNTKKSTYKEVSIKKIITSYVAMVERLADNIIGILADEE